MDTNPITFEEYKKEIEQAIARTMLTQLEGKVITYDQLQQISKFVLLGIDNIKDSDGLVGFLENLAGKWSIFENIYNLYKMKAADALYKEQKLQEAENNLSSVVQ